MALIRQVHGTQAEVAGWVAADFGIDLVALEPVGHGADVSAQLWRGRTAYGASYAVKLGSADSSGGLVVSAHLVARGIGGVVAPVTSRDGRPWTVRAGRRLSVLPWAPGERALLGSMTADHWRSFGRLLSAVHTAEVVAEVTGVLRVEDHRHDQEVAALRSVVNRVESVAAPLDPDEVLDPLVVSLVREWAAAADVVSALLEHTEAMGRTVGPSRAAGVICHGDPHLGNLLVGRSSAVTLVDWDDAVLAPRERDLMFLIGGGVLAFAPVTGQQQSWFFEGYGAADLDPGRLAYYRCRRAVWDLADPAAQVLDADRWSTAQRAEALSTVRGVLSGTGLVRLAVGSATHPGPRR